MFFPLFNIFFFKNGMKTKLQSITKNNKNFSIIKTNILWNFVWLQSKLISEISEKVWSLDRKMLKNWFKMCTLPSCFYRKIVVFKAKWKKDFCFSAIKFGKPSNVMRLRLKMISKINQKLVSLNLISALIV